MGGLADSQYLIVPGIIVLTSVLGLVIVGLNGYAGWEAFTTPPSERTAIKIDKVLRLQVFFYDSLMGVYLLLIVVASVVLKVKGSYCRQDAQWRSCWCCSALGVLFSFSSHGSLFTIAMMSMTRCFFCFNQFGFDVSMRTVHLISGITTLVNLGHALTPVIPLSAIENMFRSDIFLTDNTNPFFTSFRGVDMVDHLKEIHSFYFRPYV